MRRSRLPSDKRAGGAEVASDQQSPPPPSYHQLTPYFCFRPNQNHFCPRYWVSGTQDSVRRTYRYLKGHYLLFMPRERYTLTKGFNIKKQRHTNYLILGSTKYP